MNKFQGDDHLTLDFVIVASVLESVWTERVEFYWQGQTLPTVSSIGLAKMKRLAGWPQDLVDIQSLGFAPDDPTIQP